MDALRWIGRYVEALLYLAGGVGLAVWSALALDGPAAVMFPVLVLLLFGLLGRRAWRQAGAEPAPPPSVAAQDVPPPPDATAPATAPVTAPVTAPTTGPAAPSGPPPPLSDEGRDELARIVAVLADTGVWAPRVPDPAMLEEHVADRGEPVDVAGVLSAPGEAAYYHPGFRAEDHLGALVEDGWKGEQLPETLHATMAELAALVADVLPVRLEELELRAEGNHLRHRLTLTLGDERVLLDYLGDHKWLSTVPHVAVARAVRATGAPVRLASYGDDQSLWIVALRDGVTVEALNADLGPAAPDPWEWLDEQEPFASGAFRLGYFGT